MNASPILLQKKYTRIVDKLAQKAHVSLADSLDLFYRSEVYQLMSEGVSNMHCMSDDYLVEELFIEYYRRKDEESLKRLTGYAALMRYLQENRGRG